MTVYRVEVSGPESRTADDIALMLTSDDHYRTSDYVITVTVERERSWDGRFNETRFVVRLPMPDGDA